MLLFFLFAHTILFIEFQKKFKAYLILFFILLTFLFLFSYGEAVMNYLNHIRGSQWTAGNQFSKPDIIKFNFKFIFESIEGLKRFFFQPKFL